MLTVLSETHHVYNLRHCGSAHNGVINQQDILARENCWHCIQLPLHAQLSRPVADADSNCT